MATGTEISQQILADEAAVFVSQLPLGAPAAARRYVRPGGGTENELLARVLDARGGIDSWNGDERVEAALVSGGGLFGLKAVPRDLDPHRMTEWLRQECSSVMPCGVRDQRRMFTRDGITLEELDGTLVAERRPPRDSSGGRQMSTARDPLLDPALLVRLGVGLRLFFESGRGKIFFRPYPAQRLVEVTRLAVRDFLVEAEVTAVGLTHGIPAMSTRA
jgi:hypothetical protein